ncbi:MAG: protein kinase [Elusimicrobia bacterium]|nr:protein kinase [Elusimicrobiota bacterium]
MIWPWLVGLALTAAASDSLPAAHPPAKTGTTVPGKASKEAPDAEDVENLDLLLERLNEAEDVPKAAVLGPAAAMVAGPSVIAPVTPQPPWAEREKERSVQFDKEFGTGSYAGIVEFSDRCRFADGCNRLKSMDVIRGAYKFVDLENDVKENRITRESAPYTGRRTDIKTDMRGAMESFRPQAGAKPRVVADFIRASEPIVTKIFNKEELVGFAERTAATTQAAPAYANLGKTLNGAGRHVQAVAAFNQALSRDPEYQQALSGRAIAHLNLGDYPSAIIDSRSALTLDPGDMNARETLHSSQGRVAGAATTSSGGAAATARAAALGSGGPGQPGPASEASSARLSPENAGVAATGAVRAASVQALSKAKRAIELNDSGDALETLTKALAQDPNNPALLNMRATVYGRLGRWEEALRDAKAGLLLVPGNIALLTTKAIAENRTRRWNDALATANEMLAADPNNALAYAARAHAYGGLGRKDDMMRDILRAAEIDSRYRRAAEEAANLQLPSDSDILFLFPGETRATAGSAPQSAPASSGRSGSFGLLVGAAIGGGLLLALGLLSIVLAPVKQAVVSVFTKSSRAPQAGPAPLFKSAAPAALIRGQYEIARQIGSGGMGMVYEGTDRSLGRRVAIKKMRDELRLNARERDRFIVEAKTVASMHHPNIVDIYAIAEEGDDVYLVFEYVDGKTVHELVQLSGRLKPAEALRVTQAMGDALSYAHSRGVIHRDMKPSNVMVTGAGAVKVMDFGIARVAKDALTRYSMTNTVVGTPPYMAPEQEQGVVRKESDVYALAICTYEMLTGQLPFIGVSAGMLMNKINMSYIPPSRATAGLPESLDEVFLKAFQADPEKRYRTPQEFVAALGGSLGVSRPV